MNDVYIAGIGMTPFGKMPERTLRSLAEEAVRGAVEDAEADVADVDAVFFGNAVAGLMTGQEMIPGQTALRDTELLGMPIVNVENACASASTAVHLAWLYVASGQAEVALAVGAEKLTHPEKTRAFDAIASAVDVESRDQLHQSMLPPGSRGDSGSPHSLFMDIYAHIARQYMDRTGANQTAFAEVAAKNRRHGALNPRAQYRQDVSVEEVLASREVSPPLTLYMCSPISDGAAAVLLCSADYLARRKTAAVRVRASALVSGRDDGTIAVRASQRAYEAAGLGPADVDVVELHDAAAPAELMLYEELGLCELGEGASLVASGATTLGGRVPTNMSGGLISKGHPIGATGCAQIVEIVEQLRGEAGDRQVEGARIGLTENSGGWLTTEPASATVHVLSVD